MSLLFDFIFIIYAALYLPYLLLTGRWHRDFPQRLGFLPATVRQKLASSSNIWVHAVSVGEVAAVESLVRCLKARFPQYKVVVTVTTKTGYELAQKRLGSHAVVILSPLDLSWVVAGFVRSLKPKVYIAAETEIWPNLFARLNAANVPVMIANGRLSDNSFPRYCAIKGLLKGVLAHVRVFCMQSALDAERIIALGADPSRVHVTGNIKFDDLPQETGAGPAGFTVEAGTLLWVCGSTHPGEEEIALDVYKKVTQDYPQWRLVIVPRHVERAPQIVRLVEQRKASGVTVINTVGQLRSLYELASLVFVGKSLTVGGGHNIIEPAFFAKPIIIGPMMENFRDIAACFNADKAVVQVKDAHAFEAAVRDLIGNETRRQELGQRARAVIDKNQGAVARTLQYVAGLVQ